MRLGTVDAIDVADASLTVNMAGDILTGARWIGSYAPVVNDLVVVSRVGTVWVVLGKLSKQLGSSGTTYASVVLPTAAMWQGVNAVGSPTWSWFSAAGSIRQGKDYIPQINAAEWTYGSIASLLPSGATITAAKLRMTGWASDYNAAANQISPRLYSHASTSLPTASPTWIAGPWSPGGLLPGETGQWDLPSTWITALIAGTVTGFGIYSATSADDSLWDTASSGQLTISYSAPT